jgi:AraC-like DNA-binding protein
MEFYLVNSTKTLIDFEPQQRAVLSHPLLTGSQVFHYQSSSLRLLVKELVTNLFTVRYNVFQFAKNQAIEFISRQRGIHSRVMLENDLHHSVSGIGTMHQQQESVAMIWSEEAKCKALFEAGKEYKTLDIYISPAMAEELTPYFPELPNVWKDETTKSLLPYPCFVTPPVKKVIDEILDCSYDAQSSPFYFELKVSEYFYLLLQNSLRLKRSPFRFTSYDAQQIFKGREILLADLEKPPLTIRELARKVGLNEAKLKAGFKHFFDTTVFECFQHARMEKARHLLLTTNKAIKEICQMAGYPRMTNFITAFRKYYGSTPASLRRKT